MFSTKSETCTPICQYLQHHIFICCWIWRPKIGMWGKGLMGFKKFKSKTWFESVWKKNNFLHFASGWKNYYDPWQASFSSSSDILKCICRQPCQCTLTRDHKIPHFDALKVYSYGKHCEKRRNCLYQATSPFLTMFSNPIWYIFFILKAL